MRFNEPVTQRAVGMNNGMEIISTTNLKGALTSTAFANQLDESLELINDGVRKIADIVSEISDSSHEQANGIEQINIAITQIDDTTQQNAALVEEAAAASGAMNQKVKLLSGLSDQFKQET